MKARISVLITDLDNTLFQRSRGAAPFADAFDAPSSCTQSVATNAHSTREQDRQQRAGRFNF